jgi:hypothetical protein
MSARLPRAQRWVTAAVVLSAAVVPWLSTPPESTWTASTPVAPRAAPTVGVVRPLAFTSSGLVTANGVGSLGLVPVAGGAMSALATYSGSIGQAWGCGSSFAGVVTTQDGQGWKTTVVWVDTATHASTRRVIPPTQRVLGASPRGYVVADSTSASTVEIVGGTEARTNVAPMADSWACDETGYAWTESLVGGGTESAFRRSWTAVSATPVLLAQSVRNLRLLSLHAGVALLSDSHRNASTTRPISVSLVRGVAGASSAVLWTGTDAVLEGAVESDANTYLRVTDRSSGTAQSRTLARDGSGSVRSVDLAVPGPASATPLAPTAGGGGVIGVGGASGGLFAIGGLVPVRFATWSTPTRATRGGPAR